MSSLEDSIRSEMWRIRHQIQDGDDSDLALWVIPQALACSQRPLRDHPRFVQKGRSPKPLPPEARLLVVNWVTRIKTELGIRSIICLLDNSQLERHYIRGGLNLDGAGLLGYYESQGLVVKHIPTTDYVRPADREMAEALEAYNELPKPVLLHCSAAIDRTTPVAAFIQRKTTR